MAEALKIFPHLGYHLDKGVPWTTTVKEKEQESSCLKGNPPCLTLTLTILNVKFAIELLRNETLFILDGIMCILHWPIHWIVSSRQENYCIGEIIWTL